MKPLLAAAALARFAFAAPAAADPTAVSEVGTIRVPVTVIYGRPDRPNVVILLKTPTAAEAAGQAHESLRAAWLATSSPRRM